ncbi:MAG: hypothetical protein RSB65_01760 [Oscillospiraceae bacterium]
MKDKTKLLDLTKNVVIVLLFASALFLFGKTVLYEPQSILSGISGIFGGDKENSGNPAPNPESTFRSAEPIYIMSTSPEGEHYAVKYNGENKTKLFSGFSAVLGGSLGSSSKPESVSEDSWKKALSKSSVFFDYLSPRPLSSIATWLGTEISGEASEFMARRLCLSCQGDELLLYFVSSENGLAYRCKTALESSAILQKLGEYPTGNASFAFELEGKYPGLDPYFIFTEEENKLREIEATNPITPSFSGEQLLGLFDMNSRINTEYPESDGSVVYVEGNKSLRFDAAGNALFTITGNAGIPIPKSGNELSAADCIAAAGNIVQNSIGLFSGEGKLGLERIDYDQNQASYTILYNYVVGGIPVDLPKGTYAARVKVSGNTISRIELTFRKYDYLGGTLSPLPEKQAVAIASAKGGEPVLKYKDGSKGVEWDWTMNSN